jgi:hypothetical protein
MNNPLLDIIGKPIVIPVEEDGHDPSLPITANIDYLVATALEMHNIAEVKNPWFATGVGHSYANDKINEETE